MNSMVWGDILRYAHLLCVAVGLGAAVLADLQVLQRFEQRITPELLERLDQLHSVVWAALLGMWVTGLLLIFQKTGFVLENFSPKLFSKLGIVAMLTVNAILIGRLAIPMLARNIGSRLIDLPLKQKILGGWLASLSSASWLLALALGNSAVLATAGWSVFGDLIPLIYAMGLFGATVVVLSLHKLSVASAQRAEQELHFANRSMVEAPATPWETRFSIN